MSDARMTKKRVAKAHFNKLTPAEAEALALLAEECAEVIQVVTKIQRHGLQSHHPSDQFTTNRDLLHKEVGDLLAALRIAEGQHILDEPRLIAWRNTKLNRVGKYLHHIDMPGPIKMVEV
jgi:NTP pyrophosphatase (non-canonical NTP hydrolase)